MGDEEEKVNTRCNYNQIELQSIKTEKVGFLKIFLNEKKI